MIDEKTRTSLLYSLIKNSLVKDKNVKRAQVHSVFYIGDEILINEAIERTGLPEDSVRRVMKSLCESTSHHSQLGHGIRCSLFYSKPTIKGCLEENQTQLKYPEQKVEFNLQFGNGIDISYEKIQTQWEDNTPHFILIDSVEDGITETKGQYLTPYGNLVIKGLELTFNEQNEDEGIFIVDKDGSATKANKVYLNTRKMIQIRIPNIPIGESYSIEVRKRFQNNNQLYIEAYPGRVVTKSIDTTPTES